MDTEQQQRLNLLAEKARNDNTSFSELKELKQLLDAWNLSIQLEFLSGVYHHPKAQ